jgi:diguanylate cyclase (GGDEF)-like protein
MGRPIVMTTVAISLGFSILMISNFKPTALFGVLMVITMFSALVADLILLPSLMLHVELVTVWDLLKLKLGKDPQEGIPLFDGLSRSQVHYILMSGTLKKHETGDVIMVKGDISDSMYAVISGELEVVNIEEEGESESQVSSRQFIARLKAGDIVGEMGLIRSSARTATVIASKPAELIQINRRMIRRLQWLYPPTAQRFFFNLMTILCDRLENVTADLVGFSRAEALNRIHSRNSFLMRFEDEISRSQRYQNPLSLLIVEIDNMESLDQTFGAGTGEHILAETAELLAKTLRRSDNLCRFNERQLAVFLPQTKIKKARLACERLRVLLEKNVFQVNSNPVSVTACFGIGSMDPKHGKEMNDLLIGASGALAMAKSRGPNRIEESV